MKYFIDFEATQFSHEIISIGCVREDGEVFKSYVYVKPSKMSGFITRLTGITKDDVRNAPTSDEVFHNFYEWVKADRAAIFYCYGDSDITFIQSNLKRTSDMEATVALQYIHNNLVDFSIEVRKYFGLYKQISLKKLVAYYRGVDEIEQAHDALEDSMFLKEVYEHIASEEPNTDAFPEYKIGNAPTEEPAAAPTQKKKKKKKHPDSATTIEADKQPIGLCRAIRSGADVWECGDLYTATMRCIRKMRQKNPELPMSKELYNDVRKNIMEAVQNGTRYCHYFWYIK